jgi:predicted nucleic acid-binding protein
VISGIREIAECRGVMALTIELPPELERRLEKEAARLGREAGDFVRIVLEERLASLPGEAPEVSPGLAGALPRATPEEVQAFLRAEGARPVERLEDLRGNFWPEDESVDEFLAARRRWQHEGSLGFPQDQPAEIAQWIAATALLLSAPLVTHNPSDNAGVPGLTILTDANL